jgi:hypothetical protein
MSATIFTHIETINVRPGAKVARAITGAGVYDVSPRILRALQEWDEFKGLLVLAVTDGRIVGVSTRDKRVTAGSISF